MVASGHPQGDSRQLSGPPRATRPRRSRHDPPPASLLPSRAPSPPAQEPSAAGLHALIGEQLGEGADEDDAGQVAAGIETDRGPWVAALTAAGYTVFAINP